jgi:hypothetical protein
MPPAHDLPHAPQSDALSCRDMQRRPQLVSSAEQELAHRP